MNKILLGALVAALVCVLVIAPAMAQPSPFVINGYVSDSGNYPCNGPALQITNLNTSVSRDANNDSASNYYNLVLDTDDVSAGDILRFKASGCSESKIVEHTVTQTEVDAGGLFDFNITLAPAVPNVAVTVNNAGFSTILAGSTNEIPISLTLNNTGTASAVIEAVFTTNDGSGVYGLDGSGTNIIPGNNFKLGPNGGEQTLTSTTTRTLICTLGAGQTLDYDAILIVPPGQSADDYLGTIQLSW